MADGDVLHPYLARWVRRAGGESVVGAPRAPGREKRGRVRMGTVERNEKFLLLSGKDFVYQLPSNL